MQKNMLGRIKRQNKQRLYIFPNISQLTYIRVMKKEKNPMGKNNGKCKPKTQFQKDESIFAKLENKMKREEARMRAISLSKRGKKNRNEEDDEM